MFKAEASTATEAWVPKVGARVQIARNPYLEPNPPDKDRGLLSAWYWQKIGVIGEIGEETAQVTFRKAGRFTLALSNLVAANPDVEHYDEMTELDHLHSCERSLIEVRAHILAYQDAVAARWHGEMMGFPSSIAHAVEERMEQLVALNARVTALSTEAQNAELDAAKRILGEVMRIAGIERFAGDSEYVVTRSKTGVDLRKKDAHGQKE